MARVEKLSVSLPLERAKWLRKTAKERGTSISQLVDEAVQERARVAAMDDYLDQHSGVVRDRRWESSLMQRLSQRRARRA